MMFQLFPLLMSSEYNILFKGSFFLYRVSISLLIPSVCACVSVHFAASEMLDVFTLICAYFGMALYDRHDLLKYMFVLQVSNLLCLLYSHMHVLYVI